MGARQEALVANGSPVQDFMQNYLAIATFLQNKEAQNRELDQREAAQQLNAMQTLSTLFQNAPNAEAMKPFIEAIGPRTGVDTNALLNLAANIAPSEAAIRGGAAKEGRRSQTPTQQAGQNAEAASAVTTGMNQGVAAMSGFWSQALGGMPGEQLAALGGPAVMRQLTGMDPGSLAMSLAQASMAPEELGQAARIAANLRLSPAQETSFALERSGQAIQMRGQDISERGQNLQYQATMAGNRLGWAQLAQQGELGHLNLQLEQARMGMAQGGKGTGLTMGDIPEIISTQRQMLADVQKVTSPVERQQLQAGINTLNQLLNSMGVPTPNLSAADQSAFGPSSLFRPGTRSPFAAPDTVPYFFPSNLPRR